jgi:hypothetical protein
MQASQLPDRRISDKCQQNVKIHIAIPLSNLKRRINRAMTNRVLKIIRRIEPGA